MPLETLEPRLLMSASQMPNYAPLASGTTWVYSEVQDGATFTSTTQVMSKPFVVRGAKSRELRTTSTNGAVSSDYSSLDKSGVLRVHAERSQSGSSTSYETYIGPYIAMTNAVAPRSVIRSTGRVASILSTETTTGRWSGTYNVELKAVKYEKVRVPAGTFRCLRVRVTAKEVLTLGTGKVIFTSTGNQWFADAVGRVKSTATQTSVGVISNTVETSTVSSVLIGYARAR